jgi:hypothetical protein
MSNEMASILIITISIGTMKISYWLKEICKILRDKANDKQ